MTVFFEGDVVGEDIGGGNYAAYSPLFPASGSEIRLWISATNYNGAAFSVEGSADDGATWLPLINLVSGTAGSFTTNQIATLYAPPQGLSLRGKFLKNSSFTVSGSLVIGNN